jgi:hypothetical protein
METLYPAKVATLASKTVFYLSVELFTDEEGYYPNS